MRLLPDGTLMDRAARGLAEVVGVRLRERGGRRVVALVGGGDNGGDALYAVAALAEEGVAAAVRHRVGARAPRGPGGGHVGRRRGGRLAGDRGGPASRRARAGGRRRDRRRPRHRRPARPAARRRCGRARRARRLDGGCRRPAERGRPGRRGVRLLDGVRRRDRDLRRRQAGAPAAGDRAGRRGADRGRHRRRGDGRPGGAAPHPRRRRRGCGRCPAQPTTSTPAVCSASSPVARATRARRCSASPPPSPPEPGWSATWGRRPRPGSSAPPSPRRCTVSGGCRPGWWVRGSTRADESDDGRAQRDAAVDALASGDAVRRRRRRPRAARARSPARADPADAARRRAGPPADPPGPAGRARRGHRRAAGARPPARRADRRHRAAQGVDHARGRPRAPGAPSGRRPTRRRGWPRPGRGTCSPGSPARCWPRACPRWTQGAWRRWCTASRATPPTPVARCARWRWRTPYLESSRGCWPAGGIAPETLGPMTALPARPDADPLPSPHRGVPARAVVDLGAIRDNVPRSPATRGRPG